MPKRTVEYKISITQYRKFAFTKNLTPTEEAAEIKELIWDAMGSPTEDLVKIDIDHVSIQQTD